MGKIQVKRFDETDRVEEAGRGRAEVLRVNDVMVVRSVLQPGWSWKEDIQPMTGGLQSCPLRHREFVVSGRIRYDMVEGGSVEAGPGTYLDIEPGHLASVVGDEACVVVDFDEDWSDFED